MKVLIKFYKKKINEFEVLLVLLNTYVTLKYYRVNSFNHEVLSKDTNLI